jgi:hypothetical protein
MIEHHDLQMTERYAHLAPDFLKGAADLLTKKTGTRNTDGRETPVSY